MRVCVSVCVGVWACVDVSVWMYGRGCDCSCVGFVCVGVCVCV
jgi:hypothetical protein